MDKFRALVVDDESAILSLMRALFEREGYSISTADSAANAIEILKSQCFDVVITDLRMETPTSGFRVVDAAQALRPKPFTVILTAFPVPAADWIRAGADALYMKGIEAFKLPQKISGLLKRRAESEAPASSRTKIS